MSQHVTLWEMRALLSGAQSGSLLHKTQWAQSPLTQTLWNEPSGEEPCPGVVIGFNFFSVFMFKISFF